MSCLVPFNFLATTAFLGILATCILVALSEMVFLLRGRQDTGLTMVADVVLPAMGILPCGATIYSTVIPPPLNLAPSIAAAWLIVWLTVLVVL